jgi:3-hydroxybutyryl-CoA dehydrogenase
MNILVIGEEENFNECCAKFGSEHMYAREDHPDDLAEKLNDQHIVFDFAHNPVRFKTYAAKQAVIFINASNISLKQIAENAKDEKMQCTLVGFCGLPTLFNRSTLEVSLHKEADKHKLAEVCNSLNTDFLIVKDHVGLVTPRVICMIINEAYYALEEGVASSDDIDNAMKLGTNYPFGPFEWCGKIGVKNVYNLLNAVYKESKDERYKVCSLLESEYLKQP